MPPLAEVRPITPASDPTALLRSLGEPPSPLPGAAEIAVAQVVDRAAGLATALAAAGGLLAMPGDEPDDDTRSEPRPNAISPQIRRSGDRISRGNPVDNGPQGPRPGIGGVSPAGGPVTATTSGPARV